jgi:hypothetical protein
MSFVCLHAVYNGIIFKIYTTFEIFIAYNFKDVLCVFTLEYIVTFPCTDNLGGFVKAASNFYDY